jgi:hypothetical protein
MAMNESLTDGRGDSAVVLSASCSASATPAAPARHCSTPNVERIPAHEILVPADVDDVALFLVGDVRTRRCGHAARTGTDQAPG